jgi:SAM-dependent methyltransferase
MNQDLNIWNEAATDWDNLASEGSLRTILSNQALNELLPDVTGKTALDAGSGNGYYSHWLKQRGAQVTGAEASPALIKIAAAKFPNINFVQADLTAAMPFPDRAFDLILANMLLMHLSSAEMFFAEARRVLRPGGVLVFSILHPAFNFPTTRLFKSLWSKLSRRKPDGLATDYFQKGVSRRFESTVKRELTHYHRTLEDYSKLLNQNGLAITRILEPSKLPAEFLNKHPKLEYATRLPRFIFIKATAL